MFKENFRAKMRELGMSAKDVANAMEKVGYSFDAKEPHRIVQSWVAKKAYLPSVISVYSIAMALNTTVEELVGGETGAEYIIQWARNNGKLYEPPERIADIVVSLNGFTDGQLKIVRGTISGIIDGGAQGESVSPPLNQRA